MTATASLRDGPLGFVGLMGGRLAGMSGVQRPLPQRGAADWAGQNPAAPYSLPAGLLATLIGEPYLLVLLMRGRTSA